MCAERLSQHGPFLVILVSLLLAYALPSVLQIQWSPITLVSIENWDNKADFRYKL